MGCVSSSAATTEEGTGDARSMHVRPFRKTLSSVAEDPWEEQAHQQHHDGPVQPGQVAAKAGPKRMSLKEVAKATDNFGFQHLLGEGSFGLVYKGEIPDPAAAKKWGQQSDVMIKVAVKKLHQFVFQGYKNYLNEVLVLEKVQHPHLVRLVGYCHEKDEACLVYELCPKGSLAQALARGLDDGEALPWSLRVSIALEVAKALEVLHENNIIHRDLKANNILLTETHSARVTDFALAKAGPAGSQKHVSTKVLGTLGYLDPAYGETGRLTPGSDVFAFGVILLELITGRPSSSEGLTLVAAMQKHLDHSKSNLLPHVDPALGGVYAKAGVLRMSMIAKVCIRTDPEARPTMKDVVKTLMKVER